MSTRQNILFLSILLLGFSLTSSEPLGSGQKEIRRTFGFHAERIRNVSKLLSQIYLVPVCSEEARYLTREGDAEEFKKVLEERQKVGFDVKAENLTLPEVLDSLVKKYPEYKWEEDVKNGVFNIFPEENAPASVIIDTTDINGKSLYDIFYEDFDLLKINDNKISFELSQGNVYWEETKTISIKGGQKEKLRTVLNQICFQTPMPMFWVIIEKRDAFYYNGKRTIYTLRFSWYEPFESSPGKEGKDLDMYRILNWERWYKELNKETGVEFDIRGIVKTRVKLYEKLKDRFMPENPPEKTDEPKK